MAAAARITRPLGKDSQFMRAARRKGAAETMRRAEQVGQRAEQIFDEIISVEFVNDRSPDRRKTGRHLLGSARAKVESSAGEFPVVLSLGSLAERKKVGALNDGSPPHNINGSPYLYFPAGNKGQKAGPGQQGLVVAAQFGAKPSRGTRSSAYGRNAKGSATVRTQQVRHPGTKAHYFIQRSLERAVQEAYSISLSLRRK